jgi:3-methyladenine DNA glycosylase AlkD
VASPPDLDDLDRRLRAAGDRVRAERERAYLKSDLRHYGVRIPELHRIARSLARELDRDTLLAAVVELWDEPADEPVHERRFVAADLLAARTDLLGIDDAALLERLIRQARTWAIVDTLAPRVVGTLLDRDPAGWEPVLDRWVVDPDFWLRRSVLLAYLLPLRTGHGDFDRFSDYADTLLEDREFFVRKALGWVLRDTAKRRPDLIAAWLRPRITRMSGVTVREAVKPLPEPDRTALMMAWRQRPPG